MTESPDSKSLFPPLVYSLHTTLFFSGLYRYLVDCSRWGAPDAPSIPSEAAQNLEEMSDEDLHRGSSGGQLDTNEKRLETVSLSTQASCVEDEDPLD